MSGKGGGKGLMGNPKDDLSEVSDDEEEEEEEQDERKEDSSSDEVYLSHLYPFYFICIPSCLSHLYPFYPICILSTSYPFYPICMGCRENSYPPF